MYIENLVWTIKYSGVDQSSAQFLASNSPKYPQQQLSDPI